MAMAQPQQPDAAGVLRRDVVVVGGGVAAGYIARAFAEAGEGGRLAILGSEAALPYERPALSKKYLHRQQPARLPAFHTCVGGGGALQDAAFYDAAGIAVRLGAAGTVTVADVAARRLATRDGGVVEYATALVVATAGVSYGWATISTNDYHTCAIAELTRAAYCWGRLGGAGFPRRHSTLSPSCRVCRERLQWPAGY
jgi:NAD(P)H-nitrite reductase large subunit